MKTKTKKLFLSLFAFAGLTLAACGGGGSSSGDSGSSGGGSSSGGSSGGADSSESESSSESEDDSSSEEESSSEEDPGQVADIYLDVDGIAVNLYVDESYVPGDTADMAAGAKYFSKATDVFQFATIELAGEVKSGYGFGPNGDGSQRNNIVRPASEPYKVHNDAEDAIFYVYEYDGTNYGNTPGYSFWLTGHVASSEDEDPTLSGVYLATSTNDFKVDSNVKFSVDENDPNHYYFHTSFLANDKLKVYDTSKDAENDRWISNTDVYTGCGYTIDGDGNLVVVTAGEYYVDYYVNASDGNHISLYRVVSPITPVNVTITLALGDFATGATYVYAWAWGNHYGGGKLVAATSLTSITLDSVASGFVLLTSAEEITDTENFPKTGVVKQSANISEIKTGTLTYTNDNSEGKGLFTYGTPSEDARNYLLLERGTNPGQKLDLSDYNTAEYNIINVELEKDDIFSIRVDNSTEQGKWLKYDQTKENTDASVKAKFEKYSNPGQASDGNFKVAVAGSFDFYVAKDGTYVYIADHAPVVTNHYTLTIGSSVKELIEGETFIDGDSKEYTQWYIKNVTLAVDDVLVFKNNEDSIVPALEESTKFEQNATTKAITCKAAGTYDIYLKLRYQDDKLYIGDHVATTDREFTVTGATWNLDNDGGVVYAWAWGGETYKTGAWVAAELQTDKRTVKVTLKSDLTGFKCVRGDGTKWTDVAHCNWSDGLWNQTNDINPTSETTYATTWN